MATAKKATTKKPAAKKPAPKKAPVKKSTATRKTTSRKTAAQKTTFSNDDSFKVVRNPRPFMSVKFTEQTFVWFILAFAIFALSLWVLNVHLDLYRLTTDLGL
jgi:hypothetical protein